MFFPQKVGRQVGIILASITLLILMAGCNTVKKNSDNQVLNTSGVANPVVHKPVDDGSQMLSPFRINYAGYLPDQEKIAVYISEKTQTKDWELKNISGKTVLKGTSSDYRDKDHASGDSFFLIDFSAANKKGEGYYLLVDGKQSSPFAISDNPYAGLTYEFFDYFKDHRRTGDVFNRSVYNWTSQSVTLNFIADAGDQGYYTANAAEAQWSLINALEKYPQINSYYNNHSADMSKVYDELVFMNNPMDKIIFPGEKLAVAKLHTNSNDTWAKCPGASGKGGSCISRTETKATYSVARTLAAMARLHKNFGSNSDAKAQYEYAKQALANAETSPFVCLNEKDVGGEGGYYPNNDNWGLWRNRDGQRDPCAASKEADPKDNNINDDHYAALVELYLAANSLGYAADAKVLKPRIEAHPHHLRVDKFFFGAVSTEATLSLLTNRPEGMDLSNAEKNVFAYADKVIQYQTVGYPGVTFDVRSTEWNTGDRDDAVNTFRWGSNRMQLNDARIVMVAAELAYAKKNVKAAAKYTNSVLRVLDQISGTNGVALAMYTAPGYPQIEAAVSRTHDALVKDNQSGKMVLGPNNWTNANDKAMPAFGSQPGMKSFALTETGWSSREISIDANAALVPVAYFAIEVAPKILKAAK